MEHNPPDQYDDALDDQEIAELTELRPPTPCSPNELDTDYKGSRKREREVSIEPVTPSAEVAPTLEIKERRTPATKRRVLGSTLEEEDTPPTSPERPVLPSSPPHETKVRQIGEKVRGLRWDDKERMTFQDLAQADIVKQDPNALSEVDLTAQAPADVDFPIAVMPEEADMSSSPVKAVESDSDDQDKKLKRKMGERAVSGSEVPMINSAEPSKRARDGDEPDQNPRDKKRPTPPPEKSAAPAESSESTSVDETPNVAPQPKLTGFLAYASASPFASAKGPSIFGKKPSPLPSVGSEASTSASATPALASPPLVQPTPKEASTPSGVKRTGFEAFAGTSSPFASVARAKSPAAFGARSSPVIRSKSPTRRAANPLNAFASYATAKPAFATPPIKKQKQDEDSGSEVGEADKESTPPKGNGKAADSEDEGTSQPSFGERLRAEKNHENDVDERSKLDLTEREVHTGEEEEETLFQVRAKLYHLSEQNQWKERGTGLLKLNVRRDDSAGARLVMRKEAVHSLLLNVTLFKGMRCSFAQDPRYVRFSTIEGCKTVHYNLRLSSPKVADELLEEINANIPADDPRSVI